LTDLSIRKRGLISANSTYFDKALQDGAIVVEQDNYSINPDSTVLDRVYNVKGLDNMPVKIKNTGGVNGLVFTIVNTSKEFTEISELVEADFDGEIVEDTIVAFGESSLQDIIDISPQSTAIRIKIKRESAGQNTTLAGDISAD